MSLKSNTIKSPTCLSNEGIKEFSQIFRMNNYEVITSPHTVDSIPDGLDECFTNEKFYRLILNDPEASFDYFSISYKTIDNNEIIIPMGVYGISKKFETRFPFLLNTFWRNFLMMTRNDFCILYEIKENQDFYYSRILDLRKDFIKKIFQYYALIDSEYCSAMAWTLRGEKSATRTIAESLNYNRVEFLKSEMYSSIEINSDKWDYLKKCLIDWFHFDRSDEIDQESRNTSTDVLIKLKILAQGIVDYEDVSILQKNSTIKI